jgi:putative glutamine amidotransferase
MVRRPVIGITAATLHVNGANRHFVSAPYVSAVHNHGGIPILIPPAPDEGIQDYLDLVDGLLIPGGTDVNPVRYGQEPHTSLLAIDDQLDDLELALITAAYERDMPILAICRGIQSLAVALGGTLTQDLPSQHPSDQRHEVRENGRDFLAHWAPFCNQTAQR